MAFNFNTKIPGVPAESQQSLETTFSTHKVLRMPSSTHYYLNFLVLQWVTHAMNLTRYVQAGPHTKLVWIYVIYVSLSAIYAYALSPA